MYFKISRYPKIQPPVLYLVLFYVTFYINRYHFSQFSELHLLSEKKILSQIFLF